MFFPSIWTLIIFIVILSIFLMIINKFVQKKKFQRVENMMSEKYGFSKYAGDVVEYKNDQGTVLRFVGIKFIIMDVEGKILKERISYYGSIDKALSQLQS